MPVSTYSSNNFTLFHYWLCQMYINCIFSISLFNVFAQQIHANNLTATCNTLLPHWPINIYGL